MDISIFVKQFKDKSWAKAMAHTAEGRKRIETGRGNIDSNLFWVKYGLIPILEGAKKEILRNGFPAAVVKHVNKKWKFEIGGIDDILENVEIWVGNREGAKSGNAYLRFAWDYKSQKIKISSRIKRVGKPESKIAVDSDKLTKTEIKKELENFLRRVFR
jgi:hypothetical protein